jgi:Putative Ig domain
MDRRDDLTVFARARLGRGIWICMLAAMSAFLEACSGSPASTITGPVGTSVGVALSSSTGTTVVQQGASIVITASVTSDPTNAGVTWSLAGGGTLSGATKTAVTYTAPTGITGSVSPILTATAVADTAQNATAVLLVQGTPVIDSTELFPGNVSTLYTAQLSVSGGQPAFSWVLSSGTLPPGLTLGTSTTSVNTISGTPTTIGTYTFQITITDSNGKKSSIDLTMSVKATAACLLEGQYASVYSGYVGEQVAVGATSVAISSTGAITGYHDFNPAAVTISESLTGTCTTRTANNGTLQIIGVANSPVFSYAMTAALNNGRVQLINGGSSQAGTGPLEKQTPTDFLLSKLAGSFAFGALGAQPGGGRAGTVGAITFDASGHVLSGHVDSNDTGGLADAALSGSITGPNTSTGRGTMTLTATGTGGSRTMHFVYYVVNANRLFIASLDPSLPVAGFMTRQTGPFSNSSLGSPGVLTLWGAATGSQPKTVLTLGQTSGADPGSGTINLLFDTANKGTATFSQNINGAIYAVRPADGRTTIGYTLGTTTRNFVLYLDGLADGYVIELGSGVGSAGLLEAQSAGPFTTTVPGLFVSGTQFPADNAPMLLLPAVNVSGGSLSANYANGYFTMNPLNGHGIGTLNVTGATSTAMTLFIVRPDKVITLQMPTPFSNGVLAWMNSD